MFFSLSERDDKDKGRAALESGDYDEAIDYLEDYLKKHPNDAKARSMLATAYLKKSGIDELQLASKITAAADKGSNDWQSIVGVMPAGTEKNIENLQSAVDALSAIPESKRTSAQNYQLAVASASLAVAVIKKNTSDESGTYTPTDENIDAISEEDATTIMSSIATTSSASTAAGSSSSGLSKLSGINTEIQAQTGESDREKLQAFLKAKK
jgi:tetratricopeptide (TPR) repeat protein